MTDDKSLNNMQAMPTKAEERDLRSALLRSTAGVPDVDQAWEELWSLADVQGSTGSSSVQGSNVLADVQGSNVLADVQGSKEQGSTVRKLLATVAAVAACALLLFWLWPSGVKEQEGQSKESAITLLAQTDDGDDVTMRVEQGEWKETDSKKQEQGERRVVTDSHVDFQAGAARQGARGKGQEMASVVLMTTPRGKDCHLTLSDGTRVWLNADSKLEFPEQFRGARRTVRLSGEAYFEVAKDSRHPFVVETEYLTTTVLGTSFNVRAYTVSDASVTLVEGRVQVASPTVRKPVVLKPGQRLDVVGSRFSMNTVNTYAYTQRKEGFFYFPDDTMRQIMVELGRWYNKAVVFEDASHMNLRLHFVAERTQSLAEIVNSLSEMDGVNIELGSNEIVVK